MYMNLKPKKHKIIYFTTTTMASLGFISSHKILGPPIDLAPTQIYFFAQIPPIILV